MLDTNKSLKEILSNDEDLFSLELWNIADSITTVNKFRRLIGGRTKTFFTYRYNDNYYDQYVYIYVEENYPFDVENNFIYGSYNFNICKNKKSAFINDENDRSTMYFDRILTDTIKEITEEEFNAKYKEALEIKLEQLNTK